MKKKKQLTIPSVPREPAFENRRLIGLFKSSIEILKLFCYQSRPRLQTERTLAEY